jgi:hypothetical protein
MSEAKDELKKFLELYFRNGLVVVPLSLNSKVPMKGFDLAKVYDTGVVEYDWDGHEGNVGVVSGFGDLLIIDCDSAEAITWFESQEEYVQTVTVKTRRGHHYWYRLYNVPKDVERRSVNITDSDNVFKIEFLYGRRYAVAPPSVVKHDGGYHKYVFIDGYDVVKHELNIALLDYDVYKKLLEKSLKRAGKGVESRQVESKVQVYVGRVNDERSLKKLKKFLELLEICKKYYVQGVRQTIWLSLAGIGRKLGLDKGVVEDILKKELYEGMGDNDSLNRRLSAIDETYKETKAVEDLAGISLLIERVFNEEDAELALRIYGYNRGVKIPGVPVLTEDDLGRAQVLVKHATKVFALIDNDWYVLVDEGKKKGDEKRARKLKAVCAGFLIKDRGFKVNTNESVYIVYNCETRRTGRIKLDLGELQNFLGRPILDVGSVKYLLDALIRNHREKIFINEVGWYKVGGRRIFVHPLNKTTLIEHGLYCDLNERDVEHFKYVNTGRQHEVVRELLVEGCLLGVKIVLGVASLFIDENADVGSGFTVFDIGPRGAGKTTTSQFVVNLFYSTNVPLTLNATEVGFELYMKRFHNLPVLFDETALISDSKLQERIFKIASGMGKLRGTKDLSVDFTFLRSVVFVTGEADPQFSRRGAERRYVIVQSNSWEDYTKRYSAAELHQLMRMACGCAFDYIKYLEEEGDVEVKVRLPEEYQIFTFTALIEKGFNFLKRFYNLSRFEAGVLYDRLCELLSYQLEKLDLSVERFLATFAEFLLSRASHFVIRDALASQVPRNVIFGEIDPGEGRVYVTRECLEHFKDFVRLDMRTILKLFEEAEVISVQYVSEGEGFSKRYTKPRKIRYMASEIPVTVYEFDLKRLTEVLGNEFAVSMVSKVGGEASGKFLQGSGGEAGGGGRGFGGEVGGILEGREEIRIPLPDDELPF